MYLFIYLFIYLLLDSCDGVINLLHRSRNRTLGNDNKIKIAQITFCPQAPKSLIYIIIITISFGYYLM